MSCMVTQALLEGRREIVKVLHPSRVAGMVLKD